MANTLGELLLENRATGSTYQTAIAIRSGFTQIGLILTILRSFFALSPTGTRPSWAERGEVWELRPGSRLLRGRRVDGLSLGTQPSSCALMICSSFSYRLLALAAEAEHSKLSNNSGEYA